MTNDTNDSRRADGRDGADRMGADRDGTARDDPGGTIAREDLLIARVAEGVAGPADWDALFAAGRTDDSLWRRLAESQRDQAGLVAMMTRVDAAAARVETPAATTTAVAGGANDASASTAAPARRAGAIVRGSLRGHWGGWRAWTGWAVAAALVFAWSLTRSLPVDRSTAPRRGVSPASSVAEAPPRVAPGSTSPAATTPVSTEQAFQQYLEQGRADGSVLGVVPRRVILESRPDPSGNGYEIVYLQQIMERTVVPELYQLRSLDERGRPGLARYEAPPRGEM